MPKNFEIIDYKPKNELVLDPKPKNEEIVDWKPKNEAILTGHTDQIYDMTLGVGMWLGFSALTYPQAIAIKSTKSP